MNMRPFIGNRILAALGRNYEDSFFARRLVPVPLRMGQTLSTPGVPMKHAYFITEGIACMIAVLANGATVAGHMIGREGFIGLPMLFENETMPASSTVMEITGGAMRLEAALFREALNQAGKLQSLIRRYAYSQIIDIMQTAACNRLHCIEERLACCLLMVCDRVGHEFRLTHETLAQMLGSRRATVTVQAERFQRLGLIRYKYGRLQILDRRSLERITCECYRVHRHEFDNLLNSLSYD